MQEEYVEQKGTGYSSYNNMVSTVNTALSDLEKICNQLKLEENRKSLQQIQEKLANHTFAVGVMGEFKRGKSTVINSLLESEIMPADILPCSATMNRVTYDLHPHAQLKMRDGSVKDIPVEELASYVTKLTAEHENRAAEVEEAVVYYPCRFCQNGVDIVDTPGLNDDERMNKISEEVIPKLDAVVMVLTPDNPFSMSEAEFVRTKLMTSDLSRLIFIVNKIDMIRRAADRVRVVESIRAKIQESVMQKTADVYGLDSQEYEDTKQKMGNIRVFPLSALDALDGKMTGDQELINKSGTLAFEEALTKMLTEDRGALELGGPLSTIARTSNEIAKAVTVRKNSLALSAQEFAQCQNEALEQIRTLRQSKQQEKRRLKDNAIQAKVELNDLVKGFYPRLRQKLTEQIDASAEIIDLASLKNKAGQQAAAESLQGAVSKAMQAEMAVIAEQIQNRMERIIGKEILRSGQFIQDLTAQISNMQMNIGNKGPAIDAGDLMTVGIDVAAMGTGGLFGIGGIISGFRNAGVKGALVGGGISAATAFATAGLVLAVSSATIVGLPLVLISSVAGTMAGKFSTKLIFAKDIGQKKLDELKSSMKEGVDDLVTQMQVNRQLEDWANDLADSRFDQLIDSMDEECERLLRDTEASMDVIKQDMTENEMQRQQMEEDCDEILRTLEDITRRLNPISEKVSFILENM